MKKPKRPKVGADDLAAAGATAADFNALPEEEIPPPTSPMPVDAPYLLQNGRICRRRRTRDTTLVEPLANFAATIVEEITVDDGAEDVKQFVVEARLADAAGVVTAHVPAEKFVEMGWVTRHLGARFIVTAGLGSRDAAHATHDCPRGQRRTSQWLTKRPRSPSPTRVPTPLASSRLGRRLLDASDAVGLPGRIAARSLVAAPPPEPPLVVPGEIGIPEEVHGESLPRPLSEMRRRPFTVRMDLAGRSCGH
jgi:hypothetical protein